MMKKMLALVLALLMLGVGAAMAEGTQEEQPQEKTISVSSSFDITIELPAGYQMTKEVGDGMIYAEIFSPETDVSYTLSVAYSEELSEQDDLTKMTQEQFDEFVAVIAADYASPETRVYETSHGTRLLFIHETGTEESGYGMLMTVYQNYVVCLYMLDTVNPLSEAEIQTGVDLLSELWFVEK